MIISAVGAILALVSLATPQVYIIDSKQPVYYLPPAGNPPKNNNQNVRDNGGGCMSPGYVVPESHTRCWGCRKMNDTLLYDNTIVKRYFWGGCKVIAFPGYVQTGHVRNINITAVQCYDLVANGKGGNCSIRTGGPGRNSVEMELCHPRRNTEFRFRVKMFGSNHSTYNQRH